VKDLPAKSPGPCVLTAAQLPDDDLAASVRGSSVSAPPLAALEDDDPRPSAIG